MRANARRLINLKASTQIKTMKAEGAKVSEIADALDLDVERVADFVGVKLPEGKKPEGK